MPALGKLLHKGMLEGSESGHHGYYGVAKSLRELAGGAQCLGKEIGGLNDTLDDRDAFGSVAVE